MHFYMYQSMPELLSLSFNTTTIPTYQNDTIMPKFNSAIIALILYFQLTLRELLLYYLV